MSPLLDLLEENLQGYIERQVKYRMENLTQRLHEQLGYDASPAEHELIKGAVAMAEERIRTMVRNEVLGNLFRSAVPRNL